jgi:hypothetical protein
MTPIINRVTFLRRLLNISTDIGSKPELLNAGLSKKILKGPHPLYDISFSFLVSRRLIWLKTKKRRGEMRPEKKADVTKDKKSVNEIKISMVKAFKKAIKKISFKKTAINMRNICPLKDSRSKKRDPNLILKKVMR